MNDLIKENRRRALFICSVLPYPCRYGLQLRQATQIEALAHDYDVTIAAKTGTAVPPEALPENVTVSLDPWAFHSTSSSEQASDEMPLKRLLPTLHLKEALNVLLAIWMDKISPIPSYLKNT